MCGGTLLCCRDPSSDGRRVQEADRARKVGDWAKSEDPLTHKSKAEAVEAVWDNTNAEPWVEINAGTRAIKATQEHPFWVPSSGSWPRAGDLKIRDQLLTVDGSTVTISA